MRSVFDDVSSGVEDQRIAAFEDVQRREGDEACGGLVEAGTAVGELPSRGGGKTGSSSIAFAAKRGEHAAQIVRAQARFGDGQTRTGLRDATGLCGSQLVGEFVEPLLAAIEQI